MGGVPRRRAVGARPGRAGLVDAGRAGPVRGSRTDPRSGHAATPSTGPSWPRHRGSSRHAVVPWLIRRKRGQHDGAGQHGRAVAAVAARGRGPRANVHQARPDRLVRRGALPARTGRGVQAVPRSSPARVVGRRATNGRGRPRGPDRRDLRVVRAHADRRGIDRSGPRGAATVRRGRRRQGAAPRCSAAGPRRPAGDGMVGAAPCRADPGGGARQPTGAGRAVRRHDRRGARLPHRSRQHDRGGRDAPRAGPHRLRGPPSTPGSRDRAGVGDATAPRVPVRPGRRTCRRPGSTPSRWSAPR